MKPIPISAAKHIAKEYGYDQVIIYARVCHDSPLPHGEHMTTYGKNKEHCGAAAKIGDFLKYKIMGWIRESSATQVAEAGRFDKFAPEVPVVFKDNCAGRLEIKTSYERTHV